MEFLSPCTLLKSGLLIISRNVAMQFKVDLKWALSPNFKLFELTIVYIRLAISIVFYFFMYYYGSNVFPGKRGTPRPFLFLFTVSYID